MGLGNSGNNANSGNKGSNWRYEYNVLKALECIVTNTENGGGSGCCPATNVLLTDIKANQTNSTQIVNLPSGTQTITSSLVTASGSVTSGATTIGFTTSAAFSGTINGVTRDSGTFYGFESTPGKTLAAIPYTVVSGSITIDKIV